jgi:hypothetical protein
MAYYGPEPLGLPAGGTGYTERPAFQVNLSSTQSGTTGDGTPYTIPFDSVAFDTTNSYDTGTTMYVCPVDGIYFFNTFIFTVGNTSSTTQGQLFFSNNTQGQNFYAVEINPFAAGFASGSGFGYQASIVLQCNANDNISVLLIVSGGSAVIQVLGAPQWETGFCGFLIR